MIIGTTCLREGVLGANNPHPGDATKPTTLHMSLAEKVECDFEPPQWRKDNH